MKPQNPQSIMPPRPAEPATVALAPELLELFSQVLSQQDVARAAVIGILSGRGLKSTYRLVVSQANLVLIPEGS